MYHSKCESYDDTLHRLQLLIDLDIASGNLPSQICGVGNVHMGLHLASSWVLIGCSKGA